MLLVEGQERHLVHQKPVPFIIKGSSLEPEEEENQEKQLTHVHLENNN